MFAQLVTYVDGAVSFAPGEAIWPVIAGVCSAVSVGVGLFLVVHGTRRLLEIALDVGAGEEVVWTAWDKQQAHEGRWDRSEMYSYDGSSGRLVMKGPSGHLP